MKDMLYDFVVVAVVVVLIATFVIGDRDSMKSNMDRVAKSNTAKITELID